MIKRRGQAGEPKTSEDVPRAGPGRGGEPRRTAKNQSEVGQEQQEAWTGEELAHDRPGFFMSPFLKVCPHLHSPAPLKPIVANGLGRSSSNCWRDSGYRAPE